MPEPEISPGERRIQLESEIQSKTARILQIEAEIQNIQARIQLAKPDTDLYNRLVEQKNTLSSTLAENKKAKSKLAAELRSLTQ